MKASVRAPRLQSKLLGAVSVGLAVVLLCALAGLASAWLKLSTEVPPEVAHSRDAERLQREFRGQVQEWKNVLLRGRDDALRQRHLDAFDSEGRLVEQLARACWPARTRARVNWRRPSSACTRSCRRTITPPCRHLRRPATIPLPATTSCTAGSPGGERTGYVERARHTGGRSGGGRAFPAGAADVVGVRGVDRAGRRAVADGPGVVAAACRGAAGTGGGSRCTCSGCRRPATRGAGAQPRRDRPPRAGHAGGAVHAARRAGCTGHDGAGA